MRDNNFQSTDKQGQEGKRDEPVRDSHETRVAQMLCLRHLRSSTNSAPVVQGISEKGRGESIGISFWSGSWSGTPERFWRRLSVVLWSPNY